MELPKNKIGTLLSYQDMIIHLKNKGVKFDIIDEPQAKKILIEKNYYYKLTAYKKNFFKDVSNNKYLGLDFAYLVDLASIDMRLRYYILELSLDVEHSIKTTLLHLITNNPDEDGYSIVGEFKNKYPSNYDYIMKNLSKSRYLKRMYSKSNNNIPIWVLIELMNFSSLINLIDLYCLKYNSARLSKAKALMRYARHPRNSCAHSNIILVNIYGKHNKILNNPTSEVQSSARNMKINLNHTRYLKVHDLICLFQLHKTYCSDIQNKVAQDKGKEVIKRFNRNKDYYSKCAHIKDFKRNLVKMVDYLN